MCIKKMGFFVSVLLKRILCIVRNKKKAHISKYSCSWGCYLFYFFLLLLNNIYRYIRFLFYSFAPLIWKQFAKFMLLRKLFYGSRKQINCWMHWTSDSHSIYIRLYGSFANLWHFTDFPGFLDRVVLRFESHLYIFLIDMVNTCDNFELVFSLSVWLALKQY